MNYWTELPNGFGVYLYVRDGRKGATVAMKDDKGNLRYYRQYDYFEVNMAEAHAQAFIELGTVQSAQKESAA